MGRELVEQNGRSRRLECGNESTPPHRPRIGRQARSRQRSLYGLRRGGLHGIPDQRSLDDSGLPKELEREILSRADYVGPSAKIPDASPADGKRNENPVGGIKQRSTKIDPIVWKAFGIPEPTPEFRFATPRRWRFDYAWPSVKIALEIDGGVYTQGRHTRGAGFIKDQEKRNAAVMLGWGVLHCVPEDVKDGSIFEKIKQTIQEAMLAAGYAMHGSTSRSP